MDRTHWERLQEVFHHALDLPAAEQRAYLQAACGDDETLLTEAQAMLAQDALGRSLLDGDPPVVGETCPEDTAPFLPPDEFGPYRIRKLLGEGGMGIVYLAEREDFGNLVAIKILRNDVLSPSRRRRFTDEQRTLARMEHPLIARIYDADTLSDGTPWFAMEYVEGVPITAHCEVRKCSIPERLRLLRSACQAVQHAHSHAIIHRDLKPSNILVKADGTVKLVDFGIAKRIERGEFAEYTQTSLRAMTLAYAAPEQIRGESLGTQTDVYSLGVTLYELITGRLPFDLSGQSPTEAERTILEREPEPPSLVARRMSGARDGSKRIGKTAWGELDVLCLTAMHKDLRRRYPSAEALTRDIDHYLKGEPLEARPDTVGYRLGKFAGRNWRAISATVAICALIVALVVFFVIRLARARNAALAEATRTQRIERFMLNLFDGGDKAAGPADSLRAVTLLDRGVQNARSLNAEPVVQADLFQTLGNMYQKLGKFDRADPLLRSSLERRKLVQGPDNQEVADSLIALGLLRLDQGQVSEAERLVRQGLAMNRRHGPPDAAAVARGEYALGRVLEDRGAYAEAIKTLEDAVRLQSPQSNTDLSDSLLALGEAHYYVGHLTTADSLYNRALAMDRELYGSIHPRVADDLFNLGEVRHDLDRDREAEQYYRQALGIKQSWYGTDHPDTALMMAAVGQALVYQGRFDEAAPVLQEALAIQERIFGKVHPQVAMGLNTLGALEFKRGHLKDAERDFTRMADINRAVYDDRHYLVGIALLNLGEVYIRQNNNARAEQSYREALARFLEKLPPDHPNTVITQVRLGHVLVLERRYKEAEAHLLVGYNVLSRPPNPQAARLENTRKDLITVYDALNQPEKAKRFRAELAASASDRPATPSKR